MVALALALVAALSQEQPIGPEVPPVPSVEEKTPVTQENRS